MSRPRILFLAEGATMSHLIRPLALAESVDLDRYDVHFSAPSRFASLLQGKRFVVDDLAAISPEEFLNNLARGAPAYSTDVLRRYVQHDRELIRTVKPDLVIGDMRLSLSTSAALEKVPCAVMINAYWSPYTKRRTILPTLPITRVVPPRWLAPLYKLSEPAVYARHLREVNRVRKEVGLTPIAADYRALYTDGTYVLYPDIPEFVPAENLPKNHRYIGICQPVTAVPKPDWWEQCLADPKPKIFVSLGSSGPLATLPAILEALSTLPVSVIVSTSARQVEGLPRDSYVAGLLPYIETAAQSRVVVSHGGSGGVYPAMAAGTPVLGIPDNADMHLSTAVLEESGAGLGVRVEEASVRRLRSSLERLLFEPQFREAAKNWASIYAKYDSTQLFRQFLNDVLPCT